MSRHTRIIEVHGNDGASHLTAAENVVKRDYPNAIIIDSHFGVGRCEHGDLLVIVTYSKGV